MGALEAALRASLPMASFATSAAHGVDPAARAALAIGAATRNTVIAVAGGMAALYALLFLA